MKRSMEATGSSSSNQEKRLKEDLKQVGYNSDEEQSGKTVFKRMFKFYKKRAPPPDFSDVIDPSIVNEARGIQIQSLATNEKFLFNETHRDMLGLKDPSDWKVTTIKGREGLYILPGIVREDAHLKWLDRTFKYAEPPNVTNLTAHGTSPTSDVLKAVGKNLRWTTLGVDYNWVTKEYPFEKRQFPTELSRLAEFVCAIVGVGELKADAAIVNYYPPKSTLSPHQDRSERDLTRALVSVSFGQSAVYLTGGNSLDEPVDALWLHSGDVLVMHADQRLVYHAVPCIVSTRKFTGPDGAYSKELLDYASTSRVNITIRQVNE
ncbi:unnamed protein product, partial [Mesorhabditis belari]|uniref:Fe2OG dioxygenase domain-containing protein n=1 Tax=Mesorhabditis belari TaxID=2138241 RepID=A0AAF3FBT9_9BILA